MPRVVEHPGHRCFLTAFHQKARFSEQFSCRASYKIFLRHKKGVAVFIKTCYVGLVPHQPAMKVERNGASITITEETRLQIKSKLPFKFAVLFDILYYTGCRISEGIQIRWIDLVNDTIVLRKRNTKNKSSTREIVIPKCLVDDICKLPNEGAFIFSGRSGLGHIHRTTATYHLSYALETLGLKYQFSSHGYRRTALTNLHRNNIPLKVIMKISGHSSLGALQRYIDVNDEEVVAAVKTLW
jgi:integrase/recombinase XerD